MTSQHLSLMHVLVKSLTSNPVNTVNDIPKGILKHVAKEFDEYARLRNVEVANFEKTTESKLLSAIFEKLDTLGYYKHPELITEEEIVCQ